MIERDTTRMTRGPRRDSGLTLVEVMVALVVGLILSAGAIQIFASSRQAFRTTDAVSRIQENGRYALQFLAKDIREAGFWGCAKDVEKNVTLNPGGGMDFDGPAIHGTEGGSGAPDSLTIRGATQNLRLNLAQAMPTVSAALVVDEVTDVEVGDIMIVTDCEAADVFQVTNTQTSSSSIVHNTGVESPGNATKNFSRSYGPSATTYTAREKDYTIGTTADGEPALVRTVNGVSQVLVAGVEDMQLTYGVDSDNDETVNVYVQANNVADWDEVLAVRVALLMRSRDDNVVDTTQTYYFPGPNDATTAPDRRLYQAFNATTTIRNRLP